MPKTAYQPLAHVAGPSAAKAFVILEKKGEYEVIRYLIEKHLDVKEPQEDPSLCGDEALHEEGNFVLSYNPVRGYINLERRTIFYDMKSKSGRFPK